MSFEPITIGVGSHFPILAAAVARTTGPVLELGCGYWSTPMLRLLCRYMDFWKEGHQSGFPPGWRKLESYDTDPEWAKRFDVPCVADWEKWKPEASRYGVAFVDNSPGESRVELILRLKDKAHFIVAHDTEADIPPSGGNYRWKELDGKFKFQTIFKDFRPWTTVYSDVEEFAL